MRYESDMISPIRACLAEVWTDFIIVEELGVGYGIADVVAARPCPEGVRDRQRQRQITTLPRRAEVQVIRALRQLRDAEATFDLLAELTGISAKRLRYDTLRFLLAENFIEATDQNTFRLRGQFRPVTEEVWAVEAKTKNWFQGLCQAKRYKHFAHQVYVAIAESHRGRVRDEALHEQNVGLISVTPDAAHIEFRPRATRPRSEELFLITNERIWEQMHLTA